MVQWLLLLPGHESWGRVVTWCGHKGMWALLCHRYWARVHDDVPLPEVDIHQPWRSGPLVVAGGSSGGRGGVTRVTSTVATIVVVFATIAAIVTVVVLVLVVVAIGWSRRRGRLRLRS
jgi:hypothetical protein